MSLKDKIATFTRGETHFANKPIPGTKWIDRGFMKGAKGLGIAAALIAGTAVVGGMAASSRSGKAYRIADHANDLADLEEALPPVVTGQQLAQAMVAQQQAAGPADGRPADYWRKTVRPEAAKQQGAAPTNPEMNVVPAENVQDLGAPRTV